MARCPTLPAGARAALGPATPLPPHLLSQEQIVMKFVTRANAKVDRIACPWLISRFIDPKAEFLFVPANRVMQVAAEGSAIPYDVPDVELGHANGRCSFESMLLKYDLTDPALQELAKIVHAADVSEDLDSSPQGAGLKAIATGFALLHGEDDAKKMELEFPLYDALYAWCQWTLRPAQG
jgi:hypothetical protein